ncbi:hypothetical protein KUTeg_005417 [Tegillarca granosa]|uniref:Uncharacterized protein n=1 Tax=Tegillarca granosa TaxID=220873 RepID=A0ABQ9FJM7_TEGGR|nr:hypothetical protein KUTeg_005417 [Tegillarca granosa]
MLLSAQLWGIVMLTLCQPALQDYADGVQNAQTRLNTCRLVASLKRCMRPHMENCKNFPGIQQVLVVFQSTQEICGDGGSSSCNVQAVNDCMAEFSLSSGSAKTRQESCKLVESLRTCIDPHRDACENEPSFQQVLMMFKNTHQICADGSSGLTCNIQAVSDCMMEYKSSSSSVRTRLQTCRVIWSLRDCVAPYVNDCEDDTTMQNAMTILNDRNTRETCNDHSGSHCNTEVLSRCLTTYQTSIGSARTRLNTCRLVNSLRRCVRPLTNECQLSIAYQPIQTIFQNTEEICQDGSEGGCNVQAVSDCMSKYTASSRSARTRLGACRAYRKLEKCLKRLNQDCQGNNALDAVNDIRLTMRETCSEGELEEYCQDWNNTKIPSGEIFSPHRNEPCMRCMCDNGFMVACKEVTCLPPSCAGAQQVPDTCCEFICPIYPPTPEPEPGATCLDWNNTVIQSGEIFSPKRSDPCEKCYCSNGRTEFCRMIYCDAPPCRGAILIPDTCCGFTCPPTEEPVAEGQNTCRDWNNTIIQHGDRFSPIESDPCYRCECDNGNERYCRMIYCDAPPCPGAILIPGTCCGFTCPPTEEPVAESQNTCRDWNNTIIQHGDRFSPRESDPCFRCECNNGNERYCGMVYCDEPPCRGARPIPGTCCGFICPVERRPILEPVQESSSTCRDWNNTIIQNGNMYSPRENDLCYRCLCDNGEMRYCKTVFCDVPSCPGARPLPGICCGFICPVAIEQPTPEPEPLNKECPEGWTKHESKCYYVSRDKLSWASSQVICKSINGKLVEIASAEENDFVKELATSKGATNFWIGVTDMEVAGSYKFPGKSTALEYTDWKRRSPPKHNAYNCVEVKKARVFNWRPTKCTKRINFVCQRYP